MLNQSENSKLLTNIVKSLETKLRVLNLRDKKLNYHYSTRGLTIIDAK